MDTAPHTPAPTPEFDALTPQAGERGLDPLTRIGDGIVREFGGDDRKDRSRKNKKLPRRLAGLVALRAQGFDNAEIAEKLGVDRRKVKELIAEARREYGWSDLEDQIANIAVPRAVENVLKHLDNEGTRRAVMRGDAGMTRAILKGVGVFKTHSAVKQESRSETTNVLRVEIALPEMPPGVQVQQIADGSVLATPRRALAAATAPAAPIIDVTLIKESSNG